MKNIILYIMLLSISLAFNASSSKAGGFLSTASGDQSQTQKTIPRSTPQAPLEDRRIVPYKFTGLKNGSQIPCHREAEILVGDDGIEIVTHRLFTMYIYDLRKTKAPEISTSFNAEGLFIPDNSQRMERGFDMLYDTLRTLGTELDKEGKTKETTPATHETHLSLEEKTYTVLAAEIIETIMSLVQKFQVKTLYGKVIFGNIVTTGEIRARVELKNPSNEIVIFTTHPLPSKTTSKN